MTNVSRRTFLTSIFAAKLAAAPARRSVVLVYVDDLGWRDFGCTGHPYHETPHLDALARDGMRFTHAYAACPVCSPSRAALMTGKYPARLQLTDWIPGRKQWPTAKLLTPAFAQQLPLAETTLAELLRPAGYKTASIGKWHLGGAGFGPEQQGFDRNVAGTDKGSPPGYFGPFALPNLEGGTKDDLLTAALTTEAEKFLAAAQGSPFFLYFPHFAVHTPLQAPAALVEKYRKKIEFMGLTGNPVYAAMMETLDDSVGRLRAKLRELGRAEDTVFLLTGDNGGLRFEGKAKDPVTDNAPLRAGKGHLYEGGIRVPFLAAGPGVAKGVNATPVSSIDFAPTVCELAGVPAPKGLDGVSLVPPLAQAAAALLALSALLESGRSAGRGRARRRLEAD
jgi:arylsulfatase A-like enzyme